MVGAGKRIGAMMLGLAAVAAVQVPGPAMAQSAQDADARIRKVEAEVRALQRKVFPGGDGRFFASDNAAAQPGGATATPAPSTMTDVLARLDALEAQLAHLTGQVEQNTNALALLTSRVTALEPPGTQPAAPAVTPQSQVLPQSQASGVAATAVPASTAAIAASPVPAAVPAAPVAAAPQAPASLQPASAAVPAPTAAPAPAKPSAERLAAVKAITMPSTGDQGDDEYSYGFRLWEAKYYPEAQQQLRRYVDTYPGHWRQTYGRNLLGRAYLDDGKPREAAPWFLKNYQADKNGARAGDSLLLLAESMIAASDTRRACIALAEFGETYPVLASGRLREQYEADRRKVTCN